MAVYSLGRRARDRELVGSISGCSTFITTLGTSGAVTNFHMRAVAQDFWDPVESRGESPARRPGKQSHRS